MTPQLTYEAGVQDGRRAAYQEVKQKMDQLTSIEDDDCGYSHIWSDLKDWLKAQMEEQS